MSNLSKLLETSGVSDHQIKMSLLEIEFDILAKALVDLPSMQREKFFQNITYSAKKQLSKLLDSYKQIDSEELQEAQNILTEAILKNKNQTTNIELSTMHDATPLRVETHNKHEIFASLLDLSSKVNKEGLPSLETTMININDSYLENFVMKKGLEYILTGRNSKTNQNILQNLKKAMLNNIEEHLDMILEGIDQIQKGNSTKELVKILKNYL